MKIQPNVSLIIFILIVISPHTILTQWVKQNSGTHLRLNSITVMDSANAVVVGDSGLILKTSDSGRNWVKINTSITNNLKDVTSITKWSNIANTYEVVVVGDSTIAVTTDVGNTWTIEKMPYRFTACIYIQPMNKYIIAGDDEGRLFVKFTGASWYDTLLLPGESIAALGHDYHTPALSYEIVTGASANHTFRTLFPNDRWTISENPLEFYDVINGGDLNNYPQYLVGTTGHLVPEAVYWKNDLVDSLWLTDFENIEWTRYGDVIPGKPVSLRSVEAIQSFAAMCGTNGTIIRSFNEGGDWIMDSSGTDKTLNSIKFYGINKGFCVGDEGTILYYSKTITNVKTESTVGSYALYQNYPNPFNPATRIGFSIPERGNVRLTVFNVNGQEISVLLDEEMNAGEHWAVFDGGSCSTGVYFCVLSYNGQVRTTKLTLLK